MARALEGNIITDLSTLSGLSGRSEERFLIWKVAAGGVASQIIPFDCNIVELRPESQAQAGLSTDPSALTPATGMNFLSRNVIAFTISTTGVGCFHKIHSGETLYLWTSGAATVDIRIELL